MKLLTKEDFTELMEQREGPCISIYIPTFRAGKDVEQGPIRFKNAMREARRVLRERELRDTEIDGILEPAQALLDDGQFWRHQSDGLAVFLAPGWSREYRLPTHFQETVVVNDRFYAKPILPTLSRDGKFYILSISMNKVRMFEASRYDIEEVELGEDVPRSFSEVMKYFAPTTTTNRHQVTAGGNTVGHGGASFHGQDMGVDDAKMKKDLQQFFIQLDRGLAEVLRDKRDPLVLAAVDYLHPIYYSANSYPNLIPEGLMGNPDGLSARDLHRQALPIVEPSFRKGEEEAADLYQNLMGTNRASSELLPILEGAHQGRVQVLFATDRVIFWGKYTPETDEVEFHYQKQLDSEDLIDFAVFHTLRNGGTVYVVEPDRMPDAGALAAIMRY